MRKANSTLTAERARELFNYDPETGVLTWRLRTSNRVRVGNLIGYVTEYGYLSVRADKVLYLAHRIVWLHYYGCWPVNFIDHIDRCRANNRIANLQDVTSKQNNENKGSRPGSTSHLKGVCWNKARGKWQAQIAHNGEHMGLGYFHDEQAAGAAYQAAAKIYFTNSNPANLQNDK